MLWFKAPVRPGDSVTATATIKKIVQEKRRVTLDVNCAVAGAPVLEGETVVMVDRR
jgi:3-hydroxybutyryl-CoA dehydratase